jgi:DNA-binding NtrC family response regulator
MPRGNRERTHLHAAAMRPTLDSRSAFAHNRAMHPERSQADEELLQTVIAGLAGNDVLLVEDCAEDREKYALWLEAAGARIQQTSTLAEARRVLGTRPWAALIVDRLLPDGDALAWLTRESTTRASIPPCVVVSGDLDPKTYRSVYDIGAVPVPKQHMLHRDVLIAAISSAWRFASQPPKRDPLQAALDNPLALRMPPRDRET